MADWSRRQFNEGSIVDAKKERVSNHATCSIESLAYTAINWEIDQLYF